MAQAEGFRVVIVLGDGAITDQTLRVYQQKYQYDAVGNFLSIQHIVPTNTASGWTRRYHYAFDDPQQPSSNRLWRTWQGSDTWDGGTVTNQVTYAYDSHGSMLNLANVADSFKMQWDHRDMIASINLGGGGVANYQYDTGKQRTRKTITKSNGHIVEERIYLGGLELYRRWVNDVLKEEIETLHLFDGEQRLLMVDQVLETDNTSLGKRTLYRYTLSNHLGSSTVELDEQAGIISYEEYHPYGTSAYRAGRNAAEVKLKRYRYTGMERDEESGLGYHTARYLVLYLARWISCDPLFQSGKPNLYAYADDSPIRFVDHDGEAPAPIDSYMNLPVSPNKTREHGITGKGQYWTFQSKFGPKFMTLERYEKYYYPENITISVETDVSLTKTGGKGGDISMISHWRNIAKKGGNVDAAAVYKGAYDNFQDALKRNPQSNVKPTDVDKQMTQQGKQFFRELLRGDTYNRQEKLATDFNIELEPPPKPIMAKPPTVRKAQTTTVSNTPKTEPPKPVVRPTPRGSGASGMNTKPLPMVGPGLADLVSMISDAHTFVALPIAIELGSKDPEFLTKSEMTQMNMAGYELVGNVFAPYGVAWRNTWTDSFIDRIIMVQGPMWIVPGYTIESQGSPSLVGRMDGVGFTLDPKAKP